MNQQHLDNQNTSQAPLVRDDMTRCRICEKLFHDNQCVVHPTKGNLCPNGCEEYFVQPDYVSPLND